MYEIQETIIVEGKYDKNTLSQFLSANIIETAGFSIFSDKEKLNLLRRMAEKTGIIILTDSDSAGFLIRNYLKSAISGDRIKHAYIPDIPGKERRKPRASGEGTLGVEGMEKEVLLDVLKKAGATITGESAGSRNCQKLTKADLYAAGLSGKKDSAQRRRDLLIKLDLPKRLSPNSLLDVLNALYSYEELIGILRLVGEPFLE